MTEDLLSTHLIFTVNHDILTCSLLYLIAFKTSPLSVVSYVSHFTVCVSTCMFVTLVSFYMCPFYIVYCIHCMWTPWKNSVAMLATLNMGNPPVFIVLYGNKYHTIPYQK